MGGVPTWADMDGGHLGVATWVVAAPAFPHAVAGARKQRRERLGRACRFAGVAPTLPLRLDLMDAPRPRGQSAHRLIMTSRARFGRPRREVEARISRFLAAPRPT